MEVFSRRFKIQKINLNNFKTLKGHTKIAGFMHSFCNTDSTTHNPANLDLKICPKSIFQQIVDFQKRIEKTSTYYSKNWEFGGLINL